MTYWLVGIGGYILGMVVTGYSFSRKPTFESEKPDA